MAQIEKIMAGETGPSQEAAQVAPQIGIKEAQSPIPGMSLGVYEILNKHHGNGVIEAQRAKHKTHESFLESARQEAERIKLAEAQQVVNNATPEQQGSTTNLKNLPLSSDQIVNGKVVEEAVLRNAGLGDEERAQAAAELLYGKGAELTGQKKQELLEAHEEASNEEGLNEGYLAGVYNFKPEQIRRKVGKLPSYTTEERRKLFEAGLVGIVLPDWLKNLETVQKRSEFQDALKDYDRLDRLKQQRYDGMSANEKNEFDAFFQEAEDKMAEVIQGALDCPIAVFISDVIKEKYKDAVHPVRPPKTVGSAAYYGRQAAAKTREEFILEAQRLWGQDPDNEDPKTGDRTTGKFHFEETFWKYGGEVFMKKFNLSAAEVRALKQQYEGAFSYIASKAAVAIEKDLNGLPLAPGNVDQGVGDKLLIRIKEDVKKEVAKRDSDRRESRKRMSRKERLDYNDWREKFEFTWAETPEELRDVVYDWLAWFQEQLPSEAEETVFGSIQKGRESAIASLERMLPELGIDADAPLAKELRATIDAHVAVIGGVRLLEVGGKDAMEHYLKFLTDFAKNFNEHHDAIYLGNVKSAIIQDFLSESQISLGGPNDIEKPKDGDTKTYRERIEEAAIKYAATHELYIKKTDFEAAEGTRYNWHDSIEELLLTDQRDIDKANKIPDQTKRDEALARIKARTKVFQDIKKRLDKEDITREEKKAGVTQGLDKLSEKQRQVRIRARILAEMGKRGGQADRNYYDSGAIDGQMILKFRQAFAAGLKQHNLSPADEQSAIDARMADPQVQQALQKRVIAAKDAYLWKWVANYNATKHAHSREGWFPSEWDRVRLSIDRSTKLIDRALIKEQLKAMVEEVDDAYLNLSEQEIQAQLQAEIAAELTKKPDFQNMTEQQKGQKFAEEFANRLQLIQFRGKQRDVEAASAFNINRAYQKFLGVDARWGGLTTRRLNAEGESELVTVYSEVEEILKAKIDLEVAQVKDELKEWKLGYLATHPTITQQDLDVETAKQEKSFIDRKIEKDLKKWQKKYIHDHPKPKDDNPKKSEEKQRIFLTSFEAAKAEQSKVLAENYRRNNPGAIKQWIEEWKLGFEATHQGWPIEELEAAEIKQSRFFRRDKVFAATLGLREIGIANDLPIWNYFYYGDVSQIEAFAPLVGYTSDDKDKLVEILDRGRREMEAVFSHEADKHMDKKFGGFLVVHDDPGLVFKQDGVLKEAHEEGKMRSRVINEGGESILRDIFEKRFMISTSGGVKVPDLISKIADLGVYDFLWEMGCKDFREFQGFIKRRDESELRTQTFFNTRKWGDPVSWVKRLRGANTAGTFLTGGEVQGQGEVPGVLNEPFSGLWRYRDEFVEAAGYIAQSLQEVMGGEYKPPELMSKEDWVKFFKRENVGSTIKINNPELLAKFKANILEILSHEEVGDYLSIAKKDKMISVGGEILKFLISYMDSRKYVRNRAGYAPKNWQWDNELILRAFFGVTSKTEPVIAKEGDYNEEESKKAGRPIYYQGGEIIAETGGEMVGGDHLAYAPEGRTAVAINLFKAILSGSSYHALDSADVRTLEGKAYRAKGDMEDKRVEIKAQPLPAEFRVSLDKRAANLRRLQTDEDTIKEEADNLINSYYEKRLHMEFVGEYPVRLLAA